VSSLPRCKAKAGKRVDWHTTSVRLSENLKNWAKSLYNSGFWKLFQSVVARSLVVMPIYAYRCQECSFAKDVLQKISDAPLTECPSCGKPGFKKQLTAAGFQLKGTGWYATDFKGGKSSPAAPSAGAGTDSAANSAAAPASTLSGDASSPVA
jgi:putative FmdB family regulatory protein